MPIDNNGYVGMVDRGDFDEWLRSVDARFAVRDLEAVQAEAQRQGFVLEEVIDMPANNLSLIFRHGGQGEAGA
mgnify:CR=1 FL=1